MCTVLFMPVSDKYFFASLRDESPKRIHATAPEIDTTKNIIFLSPKDSMAGGTWVGVNELGNVIILLNGGFNNHLKENNYLKSRGLIVSELLISPMPVIDWSLMDLENIEPFTLIIWTDLSLFQLVWDGKKKSRIKLDSTIHHIWSSATLYDNEAKNIREELFQNWIVMNPPISKLTVFDFFKSFTEKENGFIMHRNENLKTLSYTFIELNESSSAIMNYYDLLNYSYSSKTINLKENTNGCILPS